MPTIESIIKEIFALDERLDRLETVVAGNERTFREIIADNAELARRLDALEKYLSDEGNINNDQDEAIAAHSRHLRALAERVERLERFATMQATEALSTWAERLRRAPPHTPLRDEACDDVTEAHT